MGTEEAREFTLMDMIPDSIKNSQASLIREFDAYASQFEGVIRLTLGEPDFNTPQKIKDAAVASLSENHTHYPPTSGTLDFRKAVCEFLKRRRGLDFEPGQIVATVGASEALRSVMGTFVGPGDVVIIPTPAFGFYESIAVQLGAQPVFIDTSRTDFKLKPETLNRTLTALEDVNTLLILNYPNNPTGASLTRAEVKALADVIARHKVGVVSDEVYALISYDEPTTSIAEFLPDRTVVVEQIAKVHQSTVATAPRPAMDAAAVGYRECDADIDAMVSEYHDRRNLLYYGLKSQGFDCASPSGAFYLYMRIPDSFPDTMTFCKAMVEKAKVACIPGDAFEKNSRSVRFSYAASQEDLREALHRISAWKSQEGF